MNGLTHLPIDHSYICSLYTHHFLYILSKIDTFFIILLLIMMDNKYDNYDDENKTEKSK